MKSFKRGTRYSFDGGVLIALALGDKRTTNLKEGLLRGEIIAYTSELALVEMTYILCRKIGWELANRKAKLLLTSGVVKVVSVSEIADEIVRIKCERALSLADCCTLALARIYNCKALFVRMERELEEELRKKPFDIELEFLAS